MTTGKNKQISVGDKLPDGNLSEYMNEETGSCSIGPNPVNVADAVKDKKIVIFGTPGAFTPTCSLQHLPGYIKLISKFKAAGVDEVWCVSVNDAFVMGAWGRQENATGAVRMIADGNADFARALGLDADFSKFGMGVRSQRYSMLVVNGIVKQVNVEQPGKFEVSNAETMLVQLA